MAPRHVCGVSGQPMDAELWRHTKPPFPHPTGPARTVNN